MKRMRFAAIACTLVLAAGVGGLSSASGSGNGAIAIGALTSLTSTFAPWGLQARDGMLLAISQINAKGGVDGHKLKLDVVDDQSSPSAGIAGFRTLTEQDHVGRRRIDSDVGVATARLTERARIPMFLIKAGASEILNINSRYTFRTCLPAAAEVAEPIVQYAEARHYTSVGAVVADYAWGLAVQSSLNDWFGHSNIKLNVQVAPVTQTDFSTYLHTLAGDNPQLLVATGHPPGSGPILAESGQLGMKEQVMGAYTPFSLVEKAAGSAAFGRWVDFKCEAVSSVGYQTLARAFLKKFPSDGFFEDDALAGYAYVNILAKAIAAVGANPVKIAKYVHTQTFNIPGYTFPLKWTAWGEIADARIAVDEIDAGPAPAGTNTAGAGTRSSCCCQVS